MKIEVTQFVVMDKNKSLFLVSARTGGLSKIPSQAKQFNTLEQAESAIQATYKLWKESKYHASQSKFEETNLATFRLKTTHELLKLPEYPF